ncbi:MAG: ankyrin repeat domain-containing protein [Candidatus Delongbacteria bacterium]|nr:ankyrin repeat domain-containing protein [Candidatus Delongbacteria bacterium]
MVRKIYKIIIVLIALFSFFSCSSNEDKLFKAVKNGDLNEVKSLIEGGVSVLSSNKNGLTPLEVARLNNQAEIVSFLYDEVKKMLDKETELLLEKKFSEQLINLKNLERERKKYYELYLESNEKLLNYLSDDKRLAEDTMLEQERYFKAHQMYIKDFINAKVDLIEDILREFVDKDYVSNIESQDTRHIVNVNIMFRLSEM